MKKLLITFFIIAALVTTISAEEKDKYTFVGVAISSKNIDFNNANSQKDATFGFRYGIQNKDYRVMTTAELDQRGYRGLTLETDSLFNTMNIYKMELKPYIGVSIGYVDHKKDNTDHAIFGIHTGAIMYINKDFDLDLGFSRQLKRKDKGINAINAVVLAVHYYF